MGQTGPKRGLNPLVGPKGHRRPARDWESTSWSPAAANIKLVVVPDGGAGPNAGPATGPAGPPPPGGDAEAHGRPSSGLPNGPSQVCVCVC